MENSNLKTAMSLLGIAALIGISIWAGVWSDDPRPGSSSSTGVFTETRVLRDNSGNILSVDEKEIDLWAETADDRADAARGRFD